jgi:hypothetical protein
MIPGFNLGQVKIVLFLEFVPTLRDFLCYPFVEGFRGLDFKDCPPNRRYPEPGQEVYNGV